MSCINQFNKVVAPIIYPFAIPEELWHNERGVEYLLMRAFLETYPQGHEVGAVTPYYFGDTSLTIIDPYDKYDRCVREDAEKYDFAGKDVLCISTIEHMGKSDYGNTDLDDQKPMRFLEKLNKEAKSFIITFPIGANTILDQWCQNNLQNYNYKIFVRTNDRPPLWIAVEDLTVFSKISYNSPFPNGNGLVVIYKG